MSARPLEGLRVVVTRPLEQSVKLVRLLEQSGAHPIVVPTIEIAAPESWDEVDAAVERLQRGDYDWIAFASVNAVEGLLERWHLPRATVKLAGVGPATSAALEAADLTVDLAPPRFTSLALADALGAGRGRILMPRVADAPPEAADALRSRGWEVDEVAVYRNVLPSELSSEAGVVRGRRFDVVTFTSTSTARNFAQLFDIAALGLGEHDDAVRVVACIGPSTAHGARRVGLRVDVVAAEHTSEGLVRAVTAHCGHIR